MATIMIVDDQAMVRELIDHALRSAGYQTIVAAHGADAVTRFNQCDVDLIVLDVSMPVMDGMTALKHIRSTGKGASTPVIMLTDHADRAAVLEFARIGISGYLLKSGFSLTELLNKVGGLVGKAAAGADSHAAAQQAAPPQTPIPNAATQAAVASSAAGESSAGQAETLQSVKPVLTKAKVNELIDGYGELKGFSPAVSEVLSLTAHAHCSIEQVSKAISRDPAIALKVLKLANSAVYACGDAVDSVHTAVLRIGLGQIRQAVLNIAVVERFSAPNEVPGIESGQFWEHSMATGIIASEIARTRNEKEVDSAFTMGLLHDVGRMVLMDQLGATYQSVLQTAVELSLPLEQVEQRMLCHTHSEIMDRVLRAWKFGKEFINPIVFHHLPAANIRQTAPKEVQEVATLALADRLAHALMLGTSGNQTIYPTEDLCELLRLDAQVIAHIEQIAREETDKVKFALLARSHQSNWPQMRDEHRKSLSKPLRPLYVSSSPAFDAHRIFCTELAPAGGSEQPNIGIVHIRNARERVAVTTQFLEQETASGATGLPVLVITSAEAIARAVGESPLASQRRCEFLQTPFSIARFLSVANALLSDSAARMAA